MLIETAIVTEINGRQLKAQARRQSTCEACSVRKGCGHGIVDSVRADNHHSVQALAAEGEVFAIGDVVRLELPESVLLRAALLTYLLPLLVMLAAVLLVSALFSGAVLTTVVAAVAGLGGGFAVTRRYTASCHHNYTPIAYRSEQDAPTVVTVLSGEF